MLGNGQIFLVLNRNYQIFIHITWQILFVGFNVSGREINKSSKGTLSSIILLTSICYIVLSIERKEPNDEVS